MDIRYLRSLIAAVDRGSIADAARQENLTAAAVGQRVKALEEELGIVLLSRSGHTARPTPACISMLPRARRLVRDEELLKGSVTSGKLGGPVRIGAISTALTGLMPSMLKKLTLAAPDCMPTVVPGTSRGLFQMLQAGELDVAVVVDPPIDIPKTLRSISLRQEPLMLLVPPTVAGEPISLLRSRPYIRYDPTAWGGRHAANWLEERGIEPRVLCDLDALEAIAMLVADGLGLSLVPKWSGLERLPNVCRALLVGDRSHERRIVLLMQKAPDVPELVALLEHIFTNTQAE